jgi:nicotinamidase-related amidase
MFTLNKAKTGLLIVDVQEKVFRAVDRQMEVLHSIQTLIKGLQILHIPIYVSEQYPTGLGPTVPGIRELLTHDVMIFSKRTFSCWKTEAIRDMIVKSGITQWILVGIETHVCILQTAKDLKMNKFDVVVLNDAVSSRSLYDFSTAISELKEDGIRVSSVETVLFELMETSEAAEFKAFSELLK